MQFLDFLQIAFFGRFDDADRRFFQQRTATMFNVSRQQVEEQDVFFSISPTHNSTSVAGNRCVTNGTKREIEEARPKSRDTFCEA